jgi:G3E family GTPase
MSLLYDVVPVTLLTGFLGSGKSTLLADAIIGDAARDTAVVVNEFGSVGLDHLLLGAIEAQPVLLDNGCICCSVRTDLKECLAELFSKRARGELPPFSRLVLETTGLALSAPIIATLLADPIVRSHYVLNAVVTVVDAANYATQRERHPEWLAQVAAADRVVVSKADLVDTAEIETLRGALAALNPAASVIVRDATMRADELMDVLAAPARLDELIQRIGRETKVFSHAAGKEPQGLSPLQHREQSGESRIGACSLTFDEPLEWEVFTLWFTMLLNRHGDRILRVKGVLWISGSEKPAVIHAVHHLVHPVLHPELPPCDERVSRLVFITDGLEQERLSASYRRFIDHLGEKNE